MKQVNRQNQYAELAESYGATCFVDRKTHQKNLRV